MARLIEYPDQRWHSYHHTVCYETPDRALHRRFDWNEDDSERAGPEMFAAALPALKHHLGQARRSKTRAGAIGMGWSYSNIVGNRALQIELGGPLSALPTKPMPEAPDPSPMLTGSGLIGCAPVPQGDLTSSSKLDPGELAYVCGGTNLRQLIVWAERRNLSLMTSGTQLGPTLAGAIATGTHGSRLGVGSIANMVRGLHIMVSPTRSIWIEPRSHAVLSDKIAHRFANRIVRSDNQFEDALVHLGAMGIVVGAIVELGPNSAYRQMRRCFVLPDFDAWARAVEERRYKDVSTIVGEASEPVFYEVSINPFAPRTRNSFHIFYHPSQSIPLAGTKDYVPRAGDAVALLSAQLLTDTRGTPPEIDLPAFYETRFNDNTKNRVSEAPYHWSGLHPDHITGGFPGALYNVGFAVEHDRFCETVAAICKAVADLPPHFIFTFRFVTGARGSMTHLRFPHTVAIEIDGFSDLVAPGTILGDTSRQAAQRVKAALVGAKIDFSMHWGKHDVDPAAKVARDFVDVLPRWQASRRALIKPSMREVFVNDLLRDLKLC